MAIQVIWKRGRSAAESKDPLRSENLEYGTFSDVGGSLDYGVATAPPPLGMTVFYARSQ